MTTRPANQIERFAMRDGCQLAVRTQVAERPQAVLIHLHANSFSSLAYMSYCRALAKEGVKPYFQDARGNGQSEGKPGDLDYIGQFEDDLNDLIAAVRSRHPTLPLFLSGHSGGAAVILRYLKKYGDSDLAGLIMLAPALQPLPEASRFDMPGSHSFFRLRYLRNPGTRRKAPTEKRPQLPRIRYGRIRLSEHFPPLQGLEVIRFPGDAKMAAVQGRTLGFSYRAAASCFTFDYENTFSRIRVPVFLRIGREDDVTEPGLIETIDRWHLHPELRRSTAIVEGADHFSIVRHALRDLVPWIHASIESAPEAAHCPGRKQA
ncbi:alpha/beta fold hydrolase [Marinobacter sp.]|uniref:alpha/beta fold hydrolase n=1 Tax=Marinobacter sp. TaxID=50741 RepID=UPI003850BB55